MKKFPNDLTDYQWQVIKDLLENGRKRRYGTRGMMNGIIYITKQGCQWQMLPGNPLHGKPFIIISDNGNSMGF